MKLKKLIKNFTKFENLKKSSFLISNKKLTIIKLR